MIIKFIIKFLPTCLPSGLTVAAPDAFGQIPGVKFERVWQITDIMRVRTPSKKITGPRNKRVLRQNCHLTQSLERRGRSRDQSQGVETLCVGRGYLGV